MATRVVPDRNGMVSIGKIKTNLVTEVALPIGGLGDGSAKTECVDTDRPEAWVEVAGEADQLTTEEKAAAFDAIAEIYEEGDNDT